MNIKELHKGGKPVSSSSLFKSEAGSATAIQILKDEKLLEHITRTPAILVCVDGEVIFENEKGFKESLRPGDYVAIEPMVKHWVVGTMESQLILIK